MKPASDSHSFEPSRRSAVPAFEVMRITDRIAERRSAGHDVVSLCAGEPNARPAPGTLKPAGYTGPLGTTELREAIAGHYLDWYGVTIPASRIAVTTGSSGAFQLIFLTAFDAGERVALATPGYPAYRNMLTALGIEVVEIPVGPANGYQITADMLEIATEVHGTLSGLVIASPANPTGTKMVRGELTAVADWCHSNGVRLVSDEIYHGITFPLPGEVDPRGATAAGMNSSAIVVNSFSKYWGMTGWRLGWAVIPDSLVAAFEALASNFALSPPAPAQELAMRAFTPESYAERDAVVAEFARSRELLLEAAPRLNWGEAAPSDGAFYYYADLGPQLQHFASSTDYAQALLEQADVALVPGSDFDLVNGQRTVRISYAAGFDALSEAIERIVRFQASL